MRLRFFSMQTYLYIGLGFSAIAIVTFILVMVFPSVFGSGSQDWGDKKRKKKE